MTPRRFVAASVVLAASATVAACASGAGSVPAETSRPAAAAGAAPSAAATEYEVVGLLHVTDQAVNVCVLELQSYPPQCGGGVPVAGVDAETLPAGLFERHEGVIWGQARLVGTFDDGILTLTRDPMPPPVPNRQPTVDPPVQPTDAARLAATAEAIGTSGRAGILSVGTSGDVVEVLVPLETDGELQADFDTEYGDGTVVVESWLHPLR